MKSENAHQAGPAESVSPDSTASEPCPSCGVPLFVGSWPFCSGGHGRPTFTAIGTDRVYFYDERLEGNPAVTSFRQHEKLLKERNCEFQKPRNSNITEY